MNGLEIVAILDKDPRVKKMFGGVLAADELPFIIRKRPSVYVVNTDIKRLPGSHWTVFYFPKRGPAEFFDSLGQAPERYHKRFRIVLLRNGPAYVYNKLRVQPYYASTCGRYCIDYVKMRCHGVNMRQIVRTMMEQNGY